MNKNLKIALVHDDLMQWGGAERVLEGLCELFPKAPIYTAVFNQSNKQLAARFGGKKVVTSFLQQIPGWKRFYRGLLPLYPLAFEQFDFTNFDLVISQTTRFAKSIITKPATRHICYIHTPPRFLWHLSGQKSFGLGETLLSKLRIYDQISAQRVDLFIAGSKNCQARVKKIYKRDSIVLYPFIDLARFEGIKSFNGGYFVIIGRMNKSNRYKGFDLVIETCQKLGIPLKVIGSGDDISFLQSKIRDSKLTEFLGNINDQLVVKILSGARALILAGEEDFGLTALEAQALGIPVIAYARGGSLETVIDQKTGLFFKKQEVKSLSEVIFALDNLKLDLLVCKKNAAQYSKEIFQRNFMQVVANL